MANRNWASGGKVYSMHVKPVLLDCNFVVDSTNGNGLGIRSLKGPCIQAVYMHTSATPATGNPNPATGTIIVQFADNYNRSFSGFNANVSPVSGTAVKIDNTALTVGVAYTITTVGDASASTWQGVGLPKGITPAVGATFIATSTGGAGNTSSSRVMTSAAAGTAIMSIETVGDPNTTINPNPQANQGYGGYMILQCRDKTGAIANPANNSVISLAFYLSDSSITIQGE